MTNIRTEMHPCPWGPEWHAIDEDSYAGPGSPAGSGATEAEAIADLKEQLDYLFCPECNSGPGEPHSNHCSLEGGPC
jgi:hypothetical protein